jgi:hypothetical protein
MLEINFVDGCRIREVEKKIDGGIGLSALERSWARRCGDAAFELAAKQQIT